MGYLYPADVTLGTAAVAAGAGTTITAIPAPGASLALRVVAIYMGIGRTAAATVVDCIVNEAGGGPGIARATGLQLTGTSALWFYPPEPGYQLPVNTGIDFTAIGTAAAGSAFVILYTFTDQST